MERVFKSSLILIPASLLLVCAASARAEDISQTLQSAKEKPWMFRVAAVTTSSLYDFGTTDPSLQRILQTDFTFLGRYKISTDFAAILNLGFTKELAGEKRYLIDDGELDLSYVGFQPWAAAKLETRLKVALPFSKQSWERDSMLTAFSVWEQATGSFGKSGLGWLGSVQGTRAFNQFDTATYGASEIQYQVLGSAGLVYSPIPAVSFSLTGSRSVSWTFPGNAMQGFGLTEELGCQIAKGMRATVGHANGGDVLRLNGQSSNIAFMSYAGSTVYAGLEYVF